MKLALNQSARTTFLSKNGKIMLAKLGNRILESQIIDIIANTQEIITILINLLTLFLIYTADQRKNFDIRTFTK